MCAHVVRPDSGPNFGLPLGARGGVSVFVFVFREVWLASGAHDGAVRGGVRLRALGHRGGCELDAVLGMFPARARRVRRAYDAWLESAELDDEGRAFRGGADAERAHLGVRH